MLPRLTALLALALGLLRIAALSLHPDKLIADAPFSLADEVEYDARSIDLRGDELAEGCPASSSTESRSARRT